MLIKNAKLQMAVDDKFCRLLAWIVLAVTAIIVAFTFKDYGVTWDEELQSQYGLAVVDYYTSFFKDQRFVEIFNLYLYGGMFDGLAAIVDRFTPFTIYDTRHLLNASFGVLGLWGTWRLGRLVGNSAVGLMALILLTLTPMYYGHMFNNPKDIPFATGIVWSLYYMGRCLADGPRVKRNLLIRLGIIYGLTLGIRVGGIMVFAFWLVPMGLNVLLPLWKKHDRKAIRSAFKLKMQYAFRLVLPVGVISYVVMLICWPWAQQNPIMNPLRALSEFSNFPQDVEVLLDGTIYRSTELPWSYVPLYFSVQLPELVLFLLGASLILMPWIWQGLGKGQRRTLIVILLTISVPILYATIRHPALYDAVRHFLFTVPLMCVLAALGARQAYLLAIGEFYRNWSRQAIAFGMLGIFTLSAMTQIAVMGQLHPYEYIYANRFAGGVQGAYGRYETDYWGSSFKEAAQRLQAYVANEGGVPSGKIYRIAICGPWDSAMIYLPPDYEPVVANEPAEFFLSTTRWMCQKMRPGKEIIQVERMGVPLSVIKDLR